MSETSGTCSQPTLFDMNEFICSAALRDGNAPSTSPDGRPTGLFGLDLVPAPRSRRQGKSTARPAAPGSASTAKTTSGASGAAPATPGTSGPRCADSSPSADLQSALASRLRAATDVNGSPEYALTWKHWDMPSGPPICALRASGHRTLDNACFGWPTPKSSDADKGVRTSRGSILEFERKGTGADLPTAATLAGWPTPDTGRDESLATWQARLERMRERHPDKGGMGSTGPLHVAAQLAGWPTPMAGSPATENYNAAGNTDSSRKTESLLAPLGGWGTPTTQDSRHATFSDSQQQRDPNVLSNQVFMAGWATPTSRDSKDGACETADVPTNGLLGRQAVRLPAVSGWATPTANEKARSEEFRAGRELNAREAFGITSPSSPAGTGNTAASQGRLNPALSGKLNSGFSLWLQGYPPEWMLCGMLASIASPSRRGKSKGGSTSLEGQETQSSPRSEPCS